MREKNLIKDLSEVVNTNMQTLQVVSTVLELHTNQITKLNKEMLEKQNKKGFWWFMNNLFNKP